MRTNITPPSNKQSLSVYELSSRGSFVKFLKKQNISLTLSEYFDDVKAGETHNGVLCQNVEALTFNNQCFDICTSLEVFEHVENDLQGFKEIFRVLKSNGVFLFTVPLNMNNKTIERTQLVDGKRINTLEPEYHSDNLRGSQKVFCYRNYGYDIVERLKKAGFAHCEILEPSKSILFGFARAVIVAGKTIKPKLN